MLGTKPDRVSARKILATVFDTSVKVQSQAFWRETFQPSLQGGTPSSCQAGLDPAQGFSTLLTALALRPQMTPPFPLFGARPAQRTPRPRTAGLPGKEEGDRMEG